MAVVEAVGVEEDLVAEAVVVLNIHNLLKFPLLITPCFQAVVVAVVVDAVAEAAEVIVRSILAHLIVWYHSVILIMHAKMI